MLLKDLPNTPPTLHHDITEISLSFLIDEPVGQFFRTLLKGGVCVECRGSVGGVLEQHSTQRKAFVHRGFRRLGGVVTFFAIFAHFCSSTQLYTQLAQAVLLLAQPVP